MTEEGRLRPHVNLFVGHQSIRFTGGLRTAVLDGAEVAILPPGQRRVTPATARPGVSAAADAAGRRSPTCWRHIA